MKPHGFFDNAGRGDAKLELLALGPFDKLVIDSLVQVALADTPDQRTGFGESLKNLSELIRRTRQSVPHRSYTR